MSFIATANPPAAGVEAVVLNDGFWPDIDPAQLRRDCRLDGTATPERLQLAIQAAMWDVNRELSDYKRQTIEATGAASLALVDAPVIGGQHLPTLQYRRAIQCHVQAQLAAEWRDLDTLPAGAGKESRVYTGLDGRIAGHHMQLRWAIADLLGAPRVIVELL